MKKYCLITILMSILIVLVGCHMFPNDRIAREQNSNGMINPYYNTDSTITALVKTAINNNDQLADIPINVETKNGHVELSGYVRTIRQSDVASELASKVDGVKFVENNLIVRKHSL